MTIGIYKITNKINDEPYVGQSRNVEKRWSNHKWKLNANRHENAYLQNAWNKYGSTAFSFEIIRECGITDLNRLEKHYIQKFDSFNNGYNLTLGGDGSLGYNHTEEWKKNMSEAMSGENNPFYGKYGEDHPKYGYKDSPETRAKKSEANKGQIPWNKGKPLSEEDKMAKSRAHNSSGFFHVSKRNCEECKNGFRWRYQYTDENGKQKEITRTDLSKLMLKVTMKDLPWRILDIDKALDTINEINKMEMVL